MYSEAAPGEITQLLRQWERGVPGSFDQLAPLVYDQLRNIAGAYFRGDRESHTLKPTGVANEAFTDLLRLRRVSLRDRSRFFAFSATLARRVLVDYARRARAFKRGWGYQRIPLDAELDWVRRTSPAEAEPETALDPSCALEELAELDPQKAQAIEIRYFLGCTVEETADLLHMPKRSLERSLDFSLAWLRRRLTPASTAQV